MEKVRWVRSFVREEAYFARGLLAEHRRSREKASRGLRTHLRFWPRTESEVPWIFPIRNGISQSLSLSLSRSTNEILRACERDRERKKESRCAEKEDLSRRDVVLTSVSRRRGPRDLDNRSRRARQGRVTVHRMKVTRIIHGPVFLFSKIERRPRGISPIGNLDLVSPFIFRSRGYAKKREKFWRELPRILYSLWKLGDERIRGFFFSGPVPVNVAQKEGGGGEERRG